MHIVLDDLLGGLRSRRRKMPKNATGRGRKKSPNGTGRDENASATSQVRDNVPKAKRKDTQQCRARGMGYKCSTGILQREKRACSRNGHRDKL